MSDIKRRLGELKRFTYGEDTFPYEVVPSVVPLNRQKTASSKIRIKVYPDLRVILSAPAHTTPDRIQKVLTRRARWIWNHLKDFKTQSEHVLSKTYESGETQFYLGRRYMLKVLEDKDSTPKVIMQRGRLDVTLPEFDENKPNKVKALVDKWYRNRAGIIFKERLKAMVEQATWLETMPDFKVFIMQTQWGSCSPKGLIMLNPHLVKAPKECIDYVITHELCHIAEHNHSERFWRLLTQVMPNWKETKAKLDGMAELYLNE